jgi:hypothetical protein
MRKTYRALYALLPLLLFTSAASAADKTTRSELEAEYAAYDKALLKGIANLPAWCEANLAADFTMAPSDGKPMNRKEFMKFVKDVAKQPGMSSSEAKEQKTAIDKITMDGADAVVLATSRGKFVMTDEAGQFGPKGKAHKITLVRKYRETWTKTGRDWKVKKSEELGGSTMIDGKPMGGPKK